MSGERLNVRARLYPARGGGFLVRFWGPDGKRHSLAVGQHEGAAGQVRAKIDTLLNVLAGGNQPTGELAEWLEGLQTLRPDWWKKFKAWGMLDSVDAAGAEPIADHVAAWRRQLEAQGLTERRVELAEQRVLGLLQAAGMSRLADLTQAAVENALLRLEGERPVSGEDGYDFTDKWGGLAPNSRLGYKQAVGQFIKWCVRTERLRGFPLERLPKVKGGTERERRALDVEEQRRLLAAAEGGEDLVGVDRQGRESYRVPGPERALLYRVALETGMRASELRSLTVGAFNLRATRPMVALKAKDEKSRRGFVWRLRKDTADLLRNRFHAKAAAAPAFDLPPAWKMADMVRADLKAARDAWIKEAKENPEEHRKRLEDDFLQPENHTGEVFDFHSLRVSFCTNLGREGLPLVVAQKLMRHSDPKLTANIYSKLGDDDHDRALDLLPAYDDDEQPEAVQATGTDGKSDTTPTPQRCNETIEMGMGGKRREMAGRVRWSGGYGRARVAGAGRSEMRRGGRGRGEKDDRNEIERRLRGRRTGGPSGARRTPDARRTRSARRAKKAGARKQASMPGLNWPGRLLRSSVRAAVLGERSGAGDPDHGPLAGARPWAAVVRDVESPPSLSGRGDRVARPSPGPSGSWRRQHPDDQLAAYAFRQVQRRAARGIVQLHIAEIPHSGLVLSGHHDLRHGDVVPAA